MIRRLFVGSICSVFLFSLGVEDAQSYQTPEEFLGVPLDNQVDEGEEDNEEIPLLPTLPASNDAPSPDPPPPADVPSPDPPPPASEPSPSGAQTPIRRGGGGGSGRRNVAPLTNQLEDVQPEVQEQLAPVMAQTSTPSSPPPPAQNVSPATYRNQPMPQTGPNTTGLILLCAGLVALFVSRKRQFSP